MAAFGLYLEGSGPAVEKPEPFFLWPENLPAWSLFLALRTQWRETSSVSVNKAGGSMSQRIELGLDYEGVEVVMRAYRLRPRHRRQRFEEIQAMERACLDVWREQRQ